jgi:hypothetical protein
LGLTIAASLVKDLFDTLDLLALSAMPINSDQQKKEQKNILGN